MWWCMPRPVRVGSGGKLRWKARKMQNGKIIDMQGREVRIGDYIVALHYHRRTRPLAVCKVIGMGADRLDVMSVYEGVLGLVYNKNEHMSAFWTTFLVVDLPDCKIKALLDALEAGEVHTRYVWEGKHPRELLEDGGV